MAPLVLEGAMVRPTISSPVHRFGLRVVALGVLALLVAAMAGTAIVEEERSLAATRATTPSPGDLSGVVVDDDAFTMGSAPPKSGPLGIAPPALPPVLQEIAEHVQPVFGTDSSHDIPNAAKAHDAELDREAAEGMTRPSAPAGPDQSQAQEAVALDKSIAAARVRPAPPPPSLAEGLGPRRRGR